MRASHRAREARRRAEGRAHHFDGVPKSEETRAKISAKLKGQKFSEERKANMTRAAQEREARRQAEERPFHFAHSSQQREKK